MDMAGANPRGDAAIDGLERARALTAGRPQAPGL
jgi:hypothetical protein